MKNIVYVAGAATAALTIIGGTSLWPMVVAAGAVGVMAGYDIRRRGELR
ncbi:hypothetical protein [Corynebacterium kalidii]